jgi:uncharacterized protein YndB with AHSA1/START domain
VIEQPIELETRIAAPPDVVFAYFVEPELYRRWKGTSAELDARPGGLYRVLMPSGDRVRGEYVAVEPPSRVVFTWGFEDNVELPPGSSTVEITLRADGDGTIVRLRHDRLPTDVSRDQHAIGWRHYLERLGIVARGGDPGSDWGDDG